MAKGVAWGDFDGDGWPDLYVSNYSTPNRLYRNRGDGTFVDVAAAAGVDRPAEQPRGGTGDFDNDGRSTSTSRRPRPCTVAEPRRPAARRCAAERFVASTLGLPTDAETRDRLYHGAGEAPGFRRTSPRHARRGSGACCSPAGSASATSTATASSTSTSAPATRATKG